MPSRRVGTSWEMALATSCTANTPMDHQDPARVDRLNPQERKILQLVAEGKSNAEAAEIMGLSPRTVETYRGRLMQKLQLEDLPSLVKYAIRHGIIPLE